MSRCDHRDDREQLSAAIAKIATHPAVEGHSIVAPADGPHGRWAIELTLTHEGLPQQVAEGLVAEGLTIRSVGPRADWWHCVAVV